MPIGGENVGTAYVRIIADGEGMDDQIRDMFDDATFNEAGKANAKAYNEAFANEAEKGPSRDALRTALARTIAVSDVSKNLLNSADWKTFRNNLSKGFGDAGRLAADNLEREITEGLDLEAVGPRIADMRRDLANAQRQLHAEQLKNVREFGEALRIEQKRQLDAELKARQDADREMDLRWADLARKAKVEIDLEREIADTIRETNQQVQQSVREMDRVVRSSERLHSTLARDNRQTLGELRREVKRLTEETDLWVKGENRALGTRRATISQISHLRDLLTQFGGHDAGISEDLDKIDARLRTATPRLSAFNANLDKLSEGLGRGFGRGSRNDFLNFFGSMVKNLTSLAFLAPKAIGSFISMGAAAKIAFGQGGGGLSGLVTALGAFAPVAASAAAAAGAFAIALGVLFVVIGPLLSLISLLIGAVTALVSSLAFALSGALVGVAGLIAPVVIGLGAIALAASSTSGVLQQRLNRAASELSDSFERLRAVTQRGVFRDIEEQARGLGNVLDGLRPLFRRVGEAVADVGTGFIESMNSPAFNNFIDTMETFIPNAVRNLGDVLRNTLGGIGGMFASAVPFIEDFIGWLEKITENFNDWANSAGGRRDVVTFLEDAKESAKSVGHFLEEAWLTLKDFLNEGKGTGDNLFDDMADAMERFRIHLEKNPDAIKNWFHDAEDLAVALGDAAVAVGELVDDLDNARSRGGLIGVIGNVDTIIGYATAFDDLVESISPVSRAIDALQLILDQVDWSKLEPSDLNFGVQINASVRGWFRSFVGILEGFGETVNRTVRGWFSNINFPDLSLNLGSIFNFRGGRGVTAGIIQPFNNLGPRILKAVGKINWRGLFDEAPGIARSFASRSAQMWQRVPGQIGGYLRRIPGLARSAFAPVPPIFSAVTQRLAPYAQSAVRNIQSAFNRLPGVLRTAIAALPGIASSSASRVAGFFSALPGRISSALAGLGAIFSNAFGRAVSAVQGIPDRIVGFFSGLGSRISSAIGSINIPRPNIPDIPGLPPPFAAGGILYGPTVLLGGEAGREAVVPLDRPLSQVDPAVRALSAIAQGIGIPSGGGTTPGKTIDASGWTIVSPSADPHAVALEAINTLTARGY